MKVLVTGSEGYIGTVLVPMLRAAGHAVTRLDSLLFQECGLAEIEARHEVVRRDIRDVTPDDIAGHDAVVHLAALSNDPLAELAPDLTTQINHVAAVRLAATARKVGVKRFVLSSTCSVYGSQGDEFITEQSPLNPLTPYAVSKCRAERDIRRLANPSFHVVCLRNGTAYGPSPMIRFDLVVNNLVAWGYTTGKVLLKNDGSAWRPLVHVEDICLAFIAALEAPTVAVTGEVFNIGRTQDNIRIRDLATMIAKFMPDCRVEYAAGAVPDKRSYRVNCSKANAALPGFRSAWNLETGVRQVVDAIRSSNIKGRQFEEYHYSRIMHLKHRLAVGSVNRQLRVSC